MRAASAARPDTAGWRPWACVAARLLVGLILVVSGAGKAGAPSEEFAVAIEAYAVLPDSLIPPAALLLPWAEVVIGFSLIGGFLTRWAAAAAAGIFAVFIMALLSTILRGIPLADCGCFGFGWHMAPSHTIILDLFLGSAALWLFRSGDAAPGLDRWAREGT